MQSENSLLTLSQAAARLPRKPEITTRGRVRRGRHAMSTFEDLSFSFEGFSGRVRLFPLPNLVLFPHVMQPLHIFEPRYRHLLEDALADDRLITMAALKPGWETDYEGRPPLYPVACLGPRLLPVCT